MHQSTSHPESRRLVIIGVLGLLMLHCAAAKTPSAGQQCEGPNMVTRVCGDGLACVPESPGSRVSVCRDSDRSPCEVARCPRVWCDSSLQYTPVGDCCPTCPPLPSITVPTISSNGCTEDDGVHYSEGETWKRDSCVTCTCEAGLPLCSSVSCVLPDCENPVHLPGECCPSCPSLSIDPIAVFIPAKTECEDNGELHENGASWKRDSCTTCFCEEGEVLCASRSCWVDCENPIHLPDVCCPICPEDGPHDDATAEPSVPAPTSLPVPSPIEPVVVFYPATVHCEHRGQIYEDGATWNPNGDMCTSCICEQGLNLCIAKSCWVDCENPVFLSDVCCPVCPGDEGYPSEPATSTIPEPTASSTTLVASSSHSPSPTPQPDVPVDVTFPTNPTTEPPTTTTEPPTTMTSPPTTSEQPSVCRDKSGTEQKDGASWCPTPAIKATCQSGVISYARHHCAAATCENPTWTPGSCHCPICPDEDDKPAVEPVAVSAVLALTYDEYLREEEAVREQLETAFRALGLTVVEIIASEYSNRQTQVVISVEPASGDKSLLKDEVLQELLDQLNSPLISFATVGHEEDSKSISDLTNNKFHHSPKRHSQGPSKTTVIIAVTASISVAVVSAIIIAVFITRAWRKRDLSKTITV